MAETVVTKYFCMVPSSSLLSCGQGGSPPVPGIRICHENAQVPPPEAQEKGRNAARVWRLDRDSPLLDCRQPHDYRFDRRYCVSLRIQLRFNNV
jgi:hypothetical protein